MQGWRNNQEDAEIVQISLDESDACLFAVFDGHGSDLVSNFSAFQFGKLLLANAHQRSGDYEKALSETFLRIDDVLTSNVGRRILFKNLLLKESGKSQEFPEQVDFDEKVTLDPKDVIDLAILLEDKVLEKQQKMPEYYSHKDIIDENPEFKCGDTDALMKLSVSNCGGCTANVGLLKRGKFYVANAGDSRSVACLNDGSTLALSQDHKPDNTEEKNRIESAGGYVSENRVNGNLNLSRAFGDFTQKLDRKFAQDKQLVIAMPEVRSVSVETVRFVILACDGIQDCVSNEELVEWFTSALKEFKSNTFAYTPRRNKDGKGNLEQGEPVKEVQLEHLVHKFLDQICARETMNSIGTDNMTCILVLLND